MTPNPTVSALAAAAATEARACGTTTLIAVDGPAGSGKTTLANRLGAALECQVIHLDDVYEGWDGLPALWGTLDPQVLQPLAQGRDGAFNRWDWETSQRAETVPVPSAAILIIEGVGAAQRGIDKYASVKIWVEAPADERLRRGLERDGEHMREHWLRFKADEDAHHAEHDTKARADFHIDGAARIEE